MRKPIKRVPTDIIDELSIYCHLLKEEGLTQVEISAIIGKDRTTVLYHIERYENLSRFNKYFRHKIKNFSERNFLREYRKTGSLNPFFDGILSVPEELNNSEDVGLLMKIVSNFNKSQLQKLINYCQVIAS